ncbi:MAG: hypothetical protein ACREKS_14075 [Candidatus Rokuibacteriota bacterium]
MHIPRTTSTAIDGHRARGKTSASPTPLARQLDGGEDDQPTRNAATEVEAEQRQPDGVETIRALAGAEKRIVAGHDPRVSERFTPGEPGIIRIA